MDPKKRKCIIFGDSEKYSEGGGWSGGEGEKHYKVIICTFTAGVEHTMFTIYCIRKANVTVHSTK